MGNGALEKHKTGSIRNVILLKIIVAKWTDKVKNEGFGKAVRKTEFMEKHC